jgi:hypothetical protein
MQPQVIHLIMCDRAFVDPRNLHRLNLNGVQVRLWTQRMLPVRIDFSAVVFLGGFTGTGSISLKVVNEATNRRVAETPARPIRFPRDSEEVSVFRSRVERCNLPSYGQYRLELWLDDEPIASRPFWLLRRA